MAVAYQSRWQKLSDEGSQALASRISERIQALTGPRPPAGGLFHAEGPTEDGGWWSFDLWADDASFEAFRADVLGPAMVDVGLDPSVGAFERLEVSWDTSQMVPPEA